MQKLKKIEGVLLFLILLFLPTQLGKHFWPDFSFIYSLKIDYLSPTIYFWDLLVLLLSVIWILGKPKVNKIALNIWLFFMLTQFISLAGAVNVGAGFVRLEQYMTAGLFGLYLSSFDFKTISSKIYLPLILGILGESVLAILQFIKGATWGFWFLGERTFSITTPAIAKFDFYGRQFLRPYATFPHPNVLAGYLLIALVTLSLGGARRYYNPERKDSGRVRMPLIAAFFLAIIAIFLAMSRVAILAGVMTALLVLRRKWLMVAIALFLIVSPVLFTRFSSLFNFDNLTLLRREELTDSAWKIFLDKPIFGTGLNNFIPAVAENIVSGPSRFLQPVHNIYLLTLAETGIVGLVGFLVLVGYPIKKIFNFQRSSDRKLCLFSIYKLIPWLIIIFLGMFDHYFLTLPQGYRLLFLLWGLFLSRVKIDR